MPIQPPRLDDRSYEDLVREARALIPQYTPEWTNLGDADPGMAIVQLFAWMTELTLYRLNRVPDKTYVHFLNFIGEERRNARAATVPLTFRPRAPDGAPSEIPAGTTASTTQAGGREPLHFLTREPLTAHGARVDRVIAAVAGAQPRVREIPFQPVIANPAAISFAGGDGVSIFRLDEVDDGADAFTSDQFLYVRHDDLVRIAARTSATPSGLLRVVAGADPGVPLAAMFDWELPVRGDGGVVWRPLPFDASAASERLGLPDVPLVPRLDGLAPIVSLGESVDPMPLPEDLPRDGWIRGRVRFERWLARLASEEMRVSWRDDRGEEERSVPTWQVRDAGHALEFAIHDLPTIRAGWSLRLGLVDHGVRAGSHAALPLYRWSFRRGDRWITLPDDRVQRVGVGFTIAGPMPELAADGWNLRAERVQSLDLAALAPGLDVALSWRRPVEVVLATGLDGDAAVAIQTEALPATPFQPVATVAPMLGTRFFVGSDLLGNRARAPVMIELEVGFEVEGEPVPEPSSDYHLQLTYRTETGWRVLPDARVDFARFTFATLDADGARRPERRRVRWFVDPSTLDGLARAEVAGQDTCWLRFELTKAALSRQEDKKLPAVPVSLKVYDARLALDGAVGATTWEEVLPGARVIAVEQRPANRRFSRCQERREGKVVTTTPFDRFIDLADDAGGHAALYLRFDRPFPAGRRFATFFRCRGETWLPRGSVAHWELLTSDGAGGSRWTRLATARDGEGGAPSLERSGVLSFGLDAPMAPAPEGTWIRGVLRVEGGEALPTLPPLTHVLPNTVEAVNLHVFRNERFSGLGVPNQSAQLRHFPVFLGDEAEARRDRPFELQVLVDEEDGEKRVWRVAPGNTFASAGKDDRVFVVDPVTGTLTFGNGIRGRMLPVGSFNVGVQSYHAVPGTVGNVAPLDIRLVEGRGDALDVSNLLPASGGRDAESIDEIIRRAPSILTSRDRAVTRRDFEVIAEEASGEVARAACPGDIDEDGVVEVVILPRRREGETVPDAFLAAGLREHVQAHLARRCLVNVRPRVRLATFLPVDVSIDVRLRQGAHRAAVREQVSAWITRFLDPYRGGIDGEGWPFGGTLYAADFARLITDIPDVRHVVDVRVFSTDGGDTRTPPGWERASGAAELVLSDADLFRPREIRVRFVEDAR